MSHVRNVNDLTAWFVSHLKFKFKKEYKPETSIEDEEEAILAILVFHDLHISGSVNFEPGRMTVQQFAQLMWREYYQLAESEDE